MPKWDYLILGQGIAGSILAYQLIKRGKKVLIIDRGLEGSSSMLAAGIINPVTGRNFIKSWIYDELIQDAVPLYLELEELLKTSLLKPRSILRYIPDLKVKNDWSVKEGDPCYREFIENVDVKSLSSCFHFPGNWIQLKGYQLNLPHLLNEFRKWFFSRNQLLEEEMDWRKVDLDSKKVSFGSHEAPFLICCDGTSLLTNPFLDASFMNPSKGEVLLLKKPGCSLDKMIKRKCFLAPFTGDKLWLGSKDSWSYNDEKPSNEGLSWLRDAASQLIKGEFETEKHLAALRPTIKDRRPVMGAIKGLPQILVFNGMGTKGTSLTPFWSGKMVQYLEDGQALSPAVRIERFFY